MFILLSTEVSATPVYIPINIQYTVLNIYFFCHVWGYRYFLTSVFYFSTKCILRRSSDSGSPKTSKEDDIIHISEKGQTQLLVVPLLFDS